MSDFPRDVVDEDGNVFRLAREPLGRGGQGVVFRSTSDPNVAVKFVAPGEPLPRREPGTRADAQLFDHLTQLPPGGPVVDGAARSQLRERLEDVRVLPLPELHVARPLSMLRSHTGYTMQLLRGMVPIRQLIAPPGASTINAFYLQGGGLRRRLDLLARSASMLLRLHSIPVVYADVSPNNLFVSADCQASEVWLIDADNLAFESALGGGVFTPGFGAPELVQGTVGATTLSDAWSFAVLAFYVLAQVHPFHGDYVDEGGWEEDEDREQLAFAGRLPWIDDADDPLNRTQRGIDRDLVSSPKLTKLFAQMFGAGRLQRTQRPSIGLFVEALRQAADYTLACAHCGWTFFAKTGRCPVCPAPRPGFFHLQVHRFDPELDPDEPQAMRAAPALLHAVLDASDAAPSVVRRHLLAPTLPSEPDPPALELQLTRGRLHVTPLDGGEYWLAGRGSERPQRVDGPLSLHLPVTGREVYLHCGSLDGPHRLVAIGYWEAER